MPRMGVCRGRHWQTTADSGRLERLHHNGSPAADGRQTKRIAVLVRERPGVQIPAAAPFKPFFLKANLPQQTLSKSADRCVFGRTFGRRSESGMGESTRTRRVRRQNKAVLKWGRHAKRKHMKPSGRTGSVFSKQLSSRSVPG